MTKYNVSPAPRLDDEPAFDPIEDEILLVLEKIETTQTVLDEASGKLRRLFEQVLSAWLYPDAVINSFDRDRPPCLLPVRVSSGNSRNALKFRIVDTPRVIVGRDGDPAMSSWFVKAVPISSKTGKDMSGNTTNGHCKDGSVTLTGSMFPPQFMFNDLNGPALAQRERDAFIQMVTQAKAILVERERGSQMGKTTQR